MTSYKQKELSKGVFWNENIQQRKRTFWALTEWW